jgi:hypothetical protein
MYTMATPTTTDASMSVIAALRSTAVRRRMAI